MEKCVEDVCQRQAEQPQDVVERVAKAIAMVSDDDNPWQNYRGFAQAAIAALGDGSATIAPVSVSAETVPSITSASDAVDWDKCDCPLVSFADGPHRHHLHKNCKGVSSDVSNTILSNHIIRCIRTYGDSTTISNAERKTDGIMIMLKELGYLHQSPVDIEAGAIACSQWVYGSNHGKPSWDRLSEEHRNEYREQARACARAWGMKWK